MSSTRCWQVHRRFRRSLLVEFGGAERIEYSGEASLKRTLYAPAAMIVILASLLLLLGSCSPERPEGQSGEDKQAGAAREDQAGGPQQESGNPKDASPPESLVPIVHLTSNRESVSKDELSQNRELAVPQGSRETAQELL